jgi:hypothetical protein
VRSVAELRAGWAVRGATASSSDGGLMGAGRAVRDGGGGGGAATSPDSGLMGVVAAGPSIELGFWGLERRRRGNSGELLRWGYRGG